MADERTGVLHQQQQLQGVGRRGLELEVTVERAGFVVQGVHRHRPHTEQVGRLHAAGDRITQQVLANPFFCALRSIANRDSRMTSTGSGMLRRTRPGAELRSNEADASA
ncbi:hypothetical protein VIMS_01306 [Mycobacterium marinum]|nr:hypothetical protein VIMS_01306 [Mycobacterium marinum]